MILLEIIELRTAAPERLKVKLKEADFLKILNPSKEKKKVKVFSNDLLQSDFSIHLEYESDEFVKSQFANQIVTILKEFGLVNHQVWQQIL